MTTTTTAVGAVRCRHAPGCDPPRHGWACPLGDPAGDVRRALAAVSDAAAPRPASADDDARRLLELRTARDAAVAATVARLSGETVAASLRAGDELEAACAAYAARWHRRRRGRVVVAGGSVWWVTPTGRTRELVGGSTVDARPLEGDHSGGWTRPPETDMSGTSRNGHSGHDPNGANRTSDITDTTGGTR